MNERNTDPSAKPATEVRQAVTLGAMRYVLMGSVGLAIVAGAIIWLTFFG